MANPESTRFAVGANLQAALSQFSAGRLLDAEALCRRVLNAAPRDPQALQLLGAIAMKRGDSDAAIEHFRAAAASAPRAPQPRGNLGLALIGKGRLKEAVTALKAAIKLDASFGPAYVNLGDALGRLDQHREAVAALRKGTALQKTDAKAFVNLGASLTRLDKYEEAEEVLRQALVIDPTLPAAHDNLGVALHHRGDFDGALACHGKALELKPDFANARFHRAMLLLAAGRFAEGWEEYLARKSVEDMPGPIHRTRLGPDMEGRSILLGRDQGLGDELFFLRFAPELKRRGARIAYKCGPKIEALLRRLPFLDQVTSDGLSPADFDMTISVGDLPYLLGAGSDADVPPSLDLATAPAALQSQRAALGRLGPPPYIAVTWRAGAGQKGALSKNVTPNALASVIKSRPGTILSLQRLPEPGEIRHLEKLIGRAVHDLSGLNDHLEEMLAALSVIDTYICVSNTNVHLRAAVGRACHVLVPFPPEFRWMSTGDRSPWFPDSRVYRQSVAGSWDDALQALSAELSRDPADHSRLPDGSAGGEAP